MPKSKIRVIKTKKKKYNNIDMLRNHDKSNIREDEQEYIEPLDYEDWKED